MSQYYYYYYYYLIESPQGGTTAAPPPLEELGLMMRGLRRVATETGVVWLGKVSASSWGMHVWSSEVLGQRRQASEDYRSRQASCASASSRQVLGKFSAHTSQIMRKSGKKLIPDPSKSRPGAPKSSPEPSKTLFLKDL